MLTATEKQVLDQLAASPSVGYAPHGRNADGEAQMLAECLLGDGRVKQTLMTISERGIEYQERHLEPPSDG
jgi:hypothetical protein